MADWLISFLILAGLFGVTYVAYERFGDWVETKRIEAHNKSLNEENDRG
jgi:hypothetical protein